MAEKSNQQLKAPNPTTAKGFMDVWFLQYYWQITIAVSLVLFVAGYFLLISPKLSNARSVGKEILVEQQLELNALQSKLEYLVTIEQERASVSSQDIEQVYSMLPIESKVPELIASLDSIANASGVIVEGIELTFVEPVISRNVVVEVEYELPSGVLAVDVSLRIATGTYGSVKALLNNIEKSLRLMDITGLLYSPSSKTYTVTVRSYYQPIQI